MAPSAWVDAQRVAWNDEPLRATWDAVSGDARMGGDWKSTSLVPCYLNDEISGLERRGRSGGGLVYREGGLLGGISGTDCDGTSEIIGAIALGYSTSAPDPSLYGGSGPILRVAIYAGDPATCETPNESPLYEAVWSGLPGHRGPLSEGSRTDYVLTVSLIGGEEFLLPDGPFHYEIEPLDVDPYNPFLSASGLLCVFSRSGLGQEDRFERWSPSVGPKSECEAVEAGLGEGSFFLALARADLSSTPAHLAVDNPGSLFGFPNPYSLTARGTTRAGEPTNGRPVLGSDVTIFIDVGSTGHTHGSVLGFLSPTELTLNEGQVLLVNLLDPAGEILGLYAPFRPAPVLYEGIPVPVNLALCGVPLYVQGVHVGGRPLGWPNFVLTNRLTLTLGG